MRMTNVTDKEKKYLIKNIKISIITPLYNTPENYLIQLIESVCLVRRMPTGNCVLRTEVMHGHDAVGERCVGQYAEKDTRIVYRKLDKNEGIVGNTNQSNPLCHR